MSSVEREDALTPDPLGPPPMTRREIDEEWDWFEHYRTDRDA